MSSTFSFGEWISQRRKALDLSQRKLADQIACTVSTIKKLESDERRPSRELAQLLADALRIPSEWRETFVECARGLRPVDALTTIEAARGSEQSGSSPPAVIRLSAPSTPFIGREAELRQIGSYLDDSTCRLLTLVGPGGIGKTRLAIEAARRQVGRFPDGVAFVPLAAVTDATLIPTSLTHSLQIPLSGLPETQLRGFLRNRAILLVLDNCEHLKESLAWLPDLLGHAPSLKLLATSRERLQLIEEWVFTVPELDDSYSAELFAETARRLGVELADQEEATATICQLVEHLPLAIELAAGWTPVLSCSEIAEQIQHNLDFLAADMRNMPARHRSVRAVFDHSWRLLSPEEQSALMKLSVFRGGWTADEAAQVAGTTLLVLRTLVDKSLVRVTKDKRFDLHELTRHYAADQLGAAGLEVPTRRQHAHVFLALAEQSAFLRSAPDILPIMAPRLHQEQDNLRAALATAMALNEAEVAARLLSALFLFWLDFGYWNEGVTWADRILTAYPDISAPLRARALVTRIMLLRRIGDNQRCASLLPEALSVVEQVGDIVGLAALLQEQSFQTKDYETATALLEKALSLSRESGHFFFAAFQLQLLGDRARIHGDLSRAAKLYNESLELLQELNVRPRTVYPIGNLGRIAFQRGDYAQARKAYETSIALARDLGYKTAMADWSLRLAEVALYQEDFAQARTTLQETLMLCREIGNQSEITEALVLSAGLALAIGRYERAARLLGAAEIALEQHHTILEPSTHTQFADYTATTQAQLDPVTFQATYTQGKRLSLEQAIDYALELQ
jgi:predicted ATPase/DNA-binding XRE family transcriptional regulator